MIETVLTVMLVGVATLGVIFAVMIIIDLWKNENNLLHR